MPTVKPQRFMRRSILTTQGQAKCFPVLDNATLSQLAESAGPSTFITLIKSPE